MRKDLERQHWTSVGSQTGSPIFVSFFSAGFYMREAWELMRSLQAYDLPYDLQEAPSRGGWLSTVNYKSAFLLEMHQEYPEEALVWLDADARIRRQPTLFGEIKEPIAFHQIAEGLPCDATVFLAPGPHREKFLKTWVDLVQKDPIGALLPPAQAEVGAPTQFYFLQAIHQEGLEVFQLPSSYCHLYDLSLDKNGRPVKTNRVPVIEQMQANRWGKKLEGL